jgi:spermidine/putrescine transport system substrate-binding protein
LATEEKMMEADHLNVPGLTRRAMLARGAGGLLAAGSMAALLEACGSSSSSSTATSTGGSATTASTTKPLAGTITLLTYPGWYGPNEFSDFKKLHPGVTVQSAVSPEGIAARQADIENHRGEFDLVLGGPPTAVQLKDSGLLAPLDVAAVPNLSLVGSNFRTSFPWGIPTDYGKTGFGYRKDLISERPTSWKEFWALSKKYSGKTTLLDFDVDVQGSALRMLGYSADSTDKTQLAAMQNALLELKPHLQAILETDYAKPLTEGTAFMAMDYDYDIALAQSRNKNIVWVSPTEGMCGYIEGWSALNTSKHLDVVWAFMNFHLDPKNYASFVNANGTAYVEPAATPYIQKSIADNPSLKYDPTALANVQFDQFLGAEATAYRGKLWEAFLSA